MWHRFHNLMLFLLHIDIYANYTFLHSASLEFGKHSIKFIIIKNYKISMQQIKFSLLYSLSPVIYRNHHNRNDDIRIVCHFENRRICFFTKMYKILYSI